MANYKWCVCDVNGKLLNLKGIISQENKNAVDDIKSAAKYITNSNNESSIAYAINNFILIS